MDSLKSSIPQVGLHRNFDLSFPSLPMPPSRLKVTCGSRKIGPRKPMWRSRVLSPEAIQAVQSLKLAKSPGKLAEVFANRISRLMKADLLDTLYELQRQNEVELALQVFNFARKEIWYEPGISIFTDMILMLGKSSNIEMAEQLFGELEKEGLRPDTRTYTEMIGAYFRIKMIEKAMESNESMKGSGCVPDKLTFRILIKNLEKTGKKELIATVKKDCLSYIKYPEKFLEEVEKTYPKRRLLNVV
ncbi:protein THYLAKOID ASSEMBLY 8-like, chloroplastic isoform X3 [Coffea arabica]|uniref:Protein THYLAKOID ASSEMBLY 8-like, chloroplastic isoform X3 n=1 Tax=Coffea arabica TaxID=13443 RepID=A0A6P6XEI5_COFAR|nr:protein THYLAKOID ASSEMBLY 8-like, chloroplastic isoform X2 [Coffea arabica]